MKNLILELRRRKVFRVAAVYMVISWLVIQVADILLSTFGAPDWVNRSLILLLAACLPIALVLAWAYEITPSGIKADNLAHTEQSAIQIPDKNIIYLIFFLVLVVAVLQVGDRIESSFSERDTVSNEALGTITMESDFSRRSVLRLGASVPKTVTEMNAEIALSRDGKKLVYSIQKPGEPPQLYLRQLNEIEAYPIQNTQGGTNPFFSSDGLWVGYVQDGLTRISVRGGAPLKIAESIYSGTTGYWDSNESILYSGDDPNGPRLKRVSPDSRESTAIDFFRIERSGSKDFWPFPLPNGAGLIFTTAAGGARDGEIQLFAYEDASIKSIIDNAYNARYVPTGHIVFVRSAALWAVPFDQDRLEVVGPEVPLIHGVQTDGFDGAAAYSLSDTGLLVYLPGEDTTAPENLRTMVWVDREGREQILALRGEFRVPSVSPSGDRLAVVVASNENNDIWIYDLVRSTLSRLTFNSAIDYFPVWSPDGERIVFLSTRDDGGLWSIAADGTGQAQPLLTGLVGPRPYTFSSDGSKLVYEHDGDLFILPMDEGSVPEKIDLTDFRETRPAISPDGNWLAYESDETGRSEIFVRPFPDVSNGKWQVSIDGGSWPQWNSDDTELLFQGPERGIWSLEYSVTNLNFEPTLPVRLFLGNYRSAENQGGFDLSVDGTSILLIKDAIVDEARSEQTDLIVIDNWFSEIQQAAPANR